MSSIVDLDVAPNDCPLTQPLSVRVAYRTTQPLSQASWSLKFIADYTHKKRVLDLGCSAPVDLDAGEHVFEYRVEGLGVEAVKESVLVNTALLSATLLAGDHTVLDIPMVTQVTRSPDGTLMRSILSPLQ